MDASTVSVLIIVALIAALLQAKGRTFLAVTALIILGALLGNTTGIVQQIATWVLNLPGLIAGLA